MVPSAFWPLKENVSFEKLLRATLWLHDLPAEKKLTGCQFLGRRFLRMSDSLVIDGWPVPLDVPGLRVSLSTYRDAEVPTPP